MQRSYVFYNVKLMGRMFRGRSEELEQAISSFLDNYHVGAKS